MNTVKETMTKRGLIAARHRFLGTCRIDFDIVQIKYLLIL